MLKGDIKHTAKEQIYNKYKLCPNIVKQWNLVIYYLSFMIKNL